MWNIATEKYKILSLHHSFTESIQCLLYRRLKLFVTFTNFYNLFSPLAEETPTAGNSPKEDKELEKQRRKLDKELKQKQKDAERKKQKDEKKRLKDEKNKAKGKGGAKQPTLDDFRASADNPIPVFLDVAIGYIEKEGLDAEGLYRVPGNRAHVDLLFQKFDEDHGVDIDSLDIAVNAVATAVKDFFFKRLPPVLDQDHMSELESISSKPNHHYLVLTLW